MQYFIKAENQDDFNSQVFAALISKIEMLDSANLRNMLLNHTIGFASTVPQKKMLRDYL